MAKYIQDGQLQKPNNLDITINENMDQDNITSWIYNHRLGYVNVFIHKNVYNNGYVFKHRETSESLVPIHPILGLDGLCKLFIGNVNDPLKAQSEGWKQLAISAINGQANISLLKGIKLQNKEQSYKIYAKRDHTILATPGLNAQTITTDRFNFVEVRITFKKLCIQYIYINKYTIYTIFILQNILH